MKAAVAGATAVLLLAVVIACGPGARPAEPARAEPRAASAGAAGSATSERAPGVAPALAPLVPIKISNPSPAVSILPFYAAIDQGFFQQHGLDASIVQLPGRVAQTALS